MNEFFRWVGIILALASLAICLIIIVRNWLWAIRGRSGKGDGSPLLFVGPLFAFIGLGLLSSRLPIESSVPMWGGFAAACVLDPAALPLIILGIWQRFRRGTSAKPE